MSFPDKYSFGDKKGVTFVTFHKNIYSGILEKTFFMTGF